MSSAKLTLLCDKTEVSVGESFSVTIIIKNNGLTSIQIPAYFAVNAFEFQFTPVNVKKGPISIFSSDRSMQFQYPHDHFPMASKEFQKLGPGEKIDYLRNLGDIMLPPPEVGKYEVAVKTEINTVPMISTPIYLDVVPSAITKLGNN